MVPIASEAMAIGATNYCMIRPGEVYMKILTFIPFAHETLVFFASSWAFIRRSYVDVSIKNGIRVMILGRHLPAFSKSILHGGQAYFL